MEDLLFLPIKNFDLPTAYQFFLNSCEISFGQDSSLWPQDLRDLTFERYVLAIHQKQNQDPESASHVWHQNMIIGQVEFSISKEHPQIGHVQLLYLVPDKRSQGIGKYLELFAANKLRSWGCQMIRLTVTPGNIQALHFYRKQGWQELGPHPAYNKALWMQKNLTSNIPHPIL